MTQLTWKGRTGLLMSAACSTAFTSSTRSSSFLVNLFHILVNLFHLLVKLYIVQVQCIAHVTMSSPVGLTNVQLLHLLFDLYIVQVHCIACLTAATPVGPTNVHAAASYVLRTALAV